MLLLFSVVRSHVIVIYCGKKSCYCYLVYGRTLRTKISLFDVKVSRFGQYLTSDWQLLAVQYTLKPLHCHYIVKLFDCLSNGLTVTILSNYTFVDIKLLKQYYFTFYIVELLNILTFLWVYLTKEIISY